MDLERFKLEIIPLRQKLLIVACKMMENETDAEDIVQEALLRLWSMRDQLDSISNPGGFAMQITKNACIDKIRTKKIEVSAETLNLEMNHHNPYSDAENNDSIQLVRKIIDLLPELQRRIILMRDVEGYELEEIAQIVGTHVSAVTMNLSRARKKVRDKFISINSFKMKNNIQEVN